MKCFAELNEDGDRIDVYFRYDPEAVAAVKRVPGARFVPAEKGGPLWRLPLDLISGERLREEFGLGLQIGDGLKAWGKAERRRERNLASLTQAADAELEHVPERAPRIAMAIAGQPIPDLDLPPGPDGKPHPLMKTRDPRPYQRADIAMMAQTNTLNANQMGCLAGDTIVELNRGGKSFKIDVAKLYRRFNGLPPRRDHGRAWMPLIPTMIRARFDDGTIRLTEVKAVYDSGRKWTVEVTTDSGRKIRSTVDHPFLTTDGWMGAQELEGQDVYVASDVQGHGRKDKTRYPYVFLRGRGQVLKSHVVIEADMNDMDLDDYIVAYHHLATELRTLEPGTVVHHKDENPYNDVLSNLEVQTGQSEHALLHGPSTRYNRGYHTTTESVVSVEPIGVQQTYDIALATNPHNFLANGFVVHNTGKTLEWLGAVVESELFSIGSIHLVCAPVRSLENVWLEEIDRFLPEAQVYTSEDASQRTHEVDQALAAHYANPDHSPIFICVNPDFIRVRKIPDPPESFYAEDLAIWEQQWANAEIAYRDYKGGTYTWRSPLQAKLLKTRFQTFNIDEFHMAGLGSSTSLFRISAGLVKAERRCAMSGTPMGGKPIRLFPILQWLEPQVYTSKWRWAEQWLVIDDNGFGKDILGIQPGREDQFYQAHAKHMVRRLKREALPGLPPKTIIDVYCSMTKKQRAQYDQFAADAEIRIDDQRLSATNVLAEYARLKQFANAYCKLETKPNGEIVVMPTEESGKLQDLLEKLNQEGIRKMDPEPRARAIVASESKRMVEMVADFLRKNKIQCDTLTGETKDSRPIIQKFKSADELPYVIVMTTTTGGVSLNLEEAGSIHILDETWNPDNQEQLEDRGDRGSRTESLRVYYYRTKDSIQEYIARVTDGKAVTNKNVLDIRRLMRQEMEGK